MNLLRLGLHNLGIVGVAAMTGQPGAALEYSEKVLSYSPIAYWILGEAAGGTAADEVNSPAQDGAYTSVTLGQTGIGDDNTCPLFDGTNSYVNLASAAFSTAFDGQEGSLLLWTKVLNAGIWSDGQRRVAAHFLDTSDYQDYIWIESPTNASQWWFRYVAATTIENIQAANGGPTAWVPIVLTWSLIAGVNGEFKAYTNGVQFGTTQTALGTWAGDPVVAQLGAFDNVPNRVWSGYLAHCAVWDRPLTPAEVTAVSTV